MALTIVGLILALLGWMLSTMSDSQGLIFTVIFFAFIISMLLSSRWILTPTEFGHRNLFFKQLYKIDRIKKIYVAQLPSDPKVVETNLKMANLMVDVTHLKMPKGSLEKLMTTRAPKQLWIDFSLPNGSVTSVPLDTFEPNRKTVGRKKMISKLGELAKLYPHLIDQSVYETEELKGLKVG